MQCHVVAEGPTDLALLRRLLEAECQPRSLRLWEVGGKEGALSLARSLLMARREPVALVVDADTVDPERVEEERRYLEGELWAVAPSPAMPKAVILFEPELEALLFHQSVPLDSALGTILVEVRIEGRYLPKASLEKLLGHPFGPDDFDTVLTPSVASALRELGPLQQLTAFLDSVVQGVH